MISKGKAEVGGQDEHTCLKFNNTSHNRLTEDLTVEKNVLVRWKY